MEALGPPARRIADCGFRIADFRFQISDFSFQISAFSFQLSAFSFQLSEGVLGTRSLITRNEHEKPPLIATLYTPGLYEQEAARLGRSIIAAGVSTPFLAQRLGTGDPGGRTGEAWDWATHRKASFLLELLEAENRPILWLDADAVVHRDPIPFLQEIDCSLAAHYRAGTELISATIWIRPCLAAKRILFRWDQLCGEQPKVWDQRLLQQAIREAGPISPPVVNLPADYCWIIDISHKSEPIPAARPVIEQLQASRERLVATRGERCLGSRRRRIAEIEAAWAAGGEPVRK